MSLSQMKQRAIIKVFTSQSLSHTKTDGKDLNYIVRGFQLITIKT